MIFKLPIFIRFWIGMGFTFVVGLIAFMLNDLSIVEIDGSSNFFWGYITAMITYGIVAFRVNGSDTKKKEDHWTSKERLD